MIHRNRILPFAGSCGKENGVVGRVHQDGSITFRGKTYTTIKEVPSQCLSLRPDVETHVQWRRMYRAVAPESRRGR
ncbi:MAG TPA: hypothetical protein VGX68_04995 [Thermoanaerobaculia bacterium]|jgi:hypothetical protein|nr:hypothetical protein [Thermoanaerobaculia bacterium]